MCTYVQLYFLAYVRMRAHMVCPHKRALIGMSLRAFVIHMLVSGHHGVPAAAPLQCVCMREFGSPLRSVEVVTPVCNFEKCRITRGASGINSLSNQRGYTRSWGPMTVWCTDSAPIFPAMCFVFCTASKLATDLCHALCPIL